MALWAAVDEIHPEDPQGRRPSHEREEPGDVRDGKNDGPGDEDHHQDQGERIRPPENPSHSLQVSTNHYWLRR